MGEFEDINEFLKRLNSIGDSTIAESNSASVSADSFDINEFLSQQMEEIKTSLSVANMVTRTRRMARDRNVTVIVDSSSDSGDEESLCDRSCSNSKCSDGSHKSESGSESDAFSVDEDRSFSAQVALKRIDERFTQALEGQGDDKEHPPPTRRASADEIWASAHMGPVVSCLTSVYQACNSKCPLKGNCAEGISGIEIANIRQEFHGLNIKDAPKDKERANSIMK